MVLGVHRERVYSPGRVDDDTRIMDATLREMAAMGYATRAVRGEELDGEVARADCVLTMAESKDVLAKLESWQQRGKRIINCVPSIQNCLRAALFTILPEAGLPVPDGKIVPVDEVASVIAPRAARQYWLKRGDVHSVGPGDVVRVANHEDVAAALGHFRRTGITRVFVQEHVEGESIKFYAIAASNFFRAFCFSGEREEVTHRMTDLRSLALLAGEATGLEVYGGDAIVTPRGEVFLVDLNDWPSFASCRQDAARHIAAHIADVLG
jgi:hypothetical protein